MRFQLLLISLSSALSLAQKIGRNYCSIPPAWIDECADDAGSGIEVALCIARRTTMSALIECIGATNTLACSSEPSWHPFGLDFDDLDTTHPEGRVCISPRRVLELAVRSPDCREEMDDDDLELEDVEELLAPISKCPEREGKGVDLYKSCLCHQGFVNSDLRTFDTCVGTEYEAPGMCQISFDGAGCRAKPSNVLPGWSCPRQLSNKGRTTRLRRNEARI